MSASVTPCLRAEWLDLTIRIVPQRWTRIPRDANCRLAPRTRTETSAGPIERVLCMNDAGAQSLMLADIYAGRT